MTKRVHITIRSASKDLDLETEYARLLKESSIHEKAIIRDLGRCALPSLFDTWPIHIELQNVSPSQLFYGRTRDRARESFQCS